MFKFALICTFAIIFSTVFVEGCASCSASSGSCGKREEKIYSDVANEPKTKDFNMIDGFFKLSEVFVKFYHSLADVFTSYLETILKEVLKIVTEMAKMASVDVSFNFLLLCFKILTKNLYLDL